MARLSRLSWRRTRIVLFLGVALAASPAACNLDLKPFVEPTDGGPIVVVPTSDTGGPSLPPPSDAGARDAGPDASDGGGVKRVFVSSVRTVGNMGGVATGDALCQAAANQARLGGTWVAFLGTAGNPAAARLTWNGPWFLVDRQTLVFTTKAAIAVGPAVRIDRDETFTRLPDERVWTGTNANGNPETDTNCANFGLGGVFGLSGVTSAMDEDWTQAGNRNCSDQQHLYCFEQQ